MAKLYPPQSDIDLLRVPPTEGERLLLDLLKESLSDDYEIYFQPFLNGDHPDVIILKEHCGAFIIEVKDWNPAHYSINDQGEWVLRKNGMRMASPCGQVRKYKNNFFDLHLAYLGYKSSASPIAGKYKKIIGTSVFLAHRDAYRFKENYDQAIADLKKEADDLNKAIRLNQRSDIDEVNKRLELIYKKKRWLINDISMFFCQHESSKLISLIRKELEPDELFDAEAYKEFKRRLTPSVFFKEQIKPIPLSIKQKRLSESKIGPERITGVAGSGKTTVMAVRAINALKRHEGRVLILTFNITLTTLIRDVFSKLLNTRNLAGIYILHYHMFLMAVMNDNNIPTHGVFDEEFSNEECIPHSPLFSGHESAIEKFDSILIDETQDFCKEWIETLKQLFLKDDGEIVLFGDDLQGIYKRNSNIKESYLIRGFGKRERLTSSFRTKVDSPLISLFGEFQSAHPHDDVDSFDKVKKDEVAQQSLDVDVIAHKTLAKNVDVAEAAKLVKSLYQKLNFIPNDTVVLASNIQFLINLEDKLGPPEKFMTTFESKEQLDAMRKWEADFSDLEIKKIRKRKKYHFQLNSGKLKLATVHSFKGLEAENVIYFLNSSDSPELVFTAISRARRNLLVLEIGNTNYHEFFASRTEKLG